MRLLKRALPLTLVIGVVYSPVGLSQSPDSTCYQRAQSQAELTACARSDARIAQARLTRLLDTLAQSLEPEAKPLLRQAQARWLEYATAHCRWEGAAYEGGSIQPMIVSGCMAAQIETRIATLKEYLCGWPPLEPECPAARAYDLVRPPPTDSRDP